jgi:hypothetical protein
MQSRRFDRWTIAFGTRLSRRTALTASAGLSGLALGTITSREAVAQDATPVASPVAGGAQATVLFVQSFAGGSLMPNQDEEGTFVLTLHGEHGRTIGFSDRPERIVGSVPTQAFLDGLGFSPTNPPNAALVIEPAPGETDVIVLELLNPRYDEGNQTLTYDVRILGAFDGSGLSFQEEPRQPDPAGEAFGPAELFIDECPTLYYCYRLNEAGGIGIGSAPIGPLPDGPVGQCWSWTTFCRPNNHPCNGPTPAELTQRCTDAYADCRGYPYPQHCVAAS